MKFLKRWLARMLVKLLKEEIHLEVDVRNKGIRTALAVAESRIKQQDRRIACLTELAVDLHEVRPQDTTIWLLSRFGEGRIDLINTHCESRKQYVELVQRLKDQYGTGSIHVDSMPQTARMFKEMVGEDE